MILAKLRYMKAIHGGKAKNDRVDAQKIAVLLRGGMLPQAYTYLAKMRATRDLLRRRLKLVRQRAERLTHIRQTNAQYNLPALGKDLKSKPQREGMIERFDDPAVQKNIEVDMALIDYYDGLIRDVERHILATAKQHDPVTLKRLQSVGAWHWSDFKPRCPFHKFAASQAAARLYGLGGYKARSNR